MMEIITAILLFLGALFMLVSAVGLVRFSDLYSRMHATTKATSFGLLLMVVGMGIFFHTGIVWLKAALVIFFIYLTAPLASHSIAQSEKKDDKK